MLISGTWGNIISGLSCTLVFVCTRLSYGLT